jgi:hypothetical protein
MITAAAIRATAILLVGAIIAPGCAGGEQSAATTPSAPGSTLASPESVEDRSATGDTARARNPAARFVRFARPCAAVRTADFGA